MSTKLIQLSKGKVALVDAEDFEAVSKFKWYYSEPRKGKCGYAARSVAGASKQYLHQFLMPGVQVDHQNRDPLDNRRDNLRAATHDQNQYNRTRRRGLLGFIGVQVNKGKFQAYIDFCHKRIHLGSHDTPEVAAQVRDLAARQLHKEFAVLNFPEKI